MRHKALVSSRTFAMVLPVGRAILEDHGFEVIRVAEEARPLNESKLAQIVSQVNPDVLITGAEPIPRAVLFASDRLKMVQKHGVGVDNIDLGAASERGIVVANAPNTNSEAVAELTIGLMLSLLRHIVQAATSTRKGEWSRFIGRELGHQTVGVVGTGRIGREVIKRLTAFGSKILAYDVYQDAAFAKENGFLYVPLDELLTTADIVTLHVPLLNDTRGLIGRTELGRMKETALLINIARGELVDEAALAEHLKSNGIAGAGIDVFSTEPPQESPLISIPNVLATPHVGAYTLEAMKCMDETCAETVCQVFAGSCPPNVLNPDVVKRM
ncbi:hydroxyacid dehydrogenase [archaeon]|nr:MAG: hydroxyacid dehydrogenase [archaeon]